LGWTFAIAFRPRISLKAITAPGVSPDVADELANNDSEGVSGAARLEGWAQQNGAPFSDVLTWLDRQDPQ
jgi:hypothetical protein